MECGDVVPVRFGKWGGRPHWERERRYLGSDWAHARSGGEEPWATVGHT